MSFLVIIVIGAFLFSIIGVIILILKTGDHAESIDHNAREIRKLKDEIRELENKISGLYNIDSKSYKINQAFQEYEEIKKDLPMFSSPDIKENKRVADEPSAALNAEISIDNTFISQEYIAIEAAVSDKSSEVRESIINKEELIIAEQVKRKDSVSLWDQLVSFAKGGNLWVAGGVALLFIAFVLLLTYMASRGFFTIEMRIAASALSGIIMFIFGWRIRKKKPAYSLILQGGGIGILYLSFFAASKLTTLLSPVAALVLITLLIPPTIILALLQHSQPLAVFGLLGGFAAPILLSDSSGNYIALFSYYTVLNIAVLVIGRYRLWRALNFLSFICTFGFLLVWVPYNYKPDIFSSVEPFVIAFIIIFTFLGIQSVNNNKIDGKKYIDLPLVIGTPFAGAVIQWQIFSKIEHGLSIISIIFAALYLLLTFVIWKSSGVNMRQLAESYLGLSVFLGNLAIPLELSPEVTSAIWAAEGALVFYYGKRYSSNKIKIAGLILHAAAAIYFILKESHIFYTSQSFRNSAFIGGLIISLSALIIALFADKIGNEEKDKVFVAEDNKEKSKTDIYLFRTLVIWGFIWWFSVWGIQINQIVIRFFQVYFIFASVSALIFFCIGKIFQSPLFFINNVVPLFCGIFIVLFAIIKQIVTLLFFHPLNIFNFNFFYELYLWGWIAFFAVQAILLYFTFKNISLKIHSAWMFITLFIFVIVLTCTGREYAVILGLSESWTSFAGIIPAMVSVLLLSIFVNYFKKLPELYSKVIFILFPNILCIATSIWFIGTLFSAGNPDPLPLYIPFINPLDIQQACCIAIIVFWQLSLHKAEIKPHLSKAKLFYLADVMVFLWLTAIVARCSHYFLDIPYYKILGSGKFHLILLILWGLYGIGHIIAGNKIMIRKIWLAGASLTIIDIIKLLIIDLAHTGTITRIISFFIAGLLLLFIGWVAPLPPRSENKPSPKE